MSLTKSSESVFTEEEEEDSFSGRYTLWIKEALEELPHNFTITDPFISGHPIVFASLGFLKMTGYSREEVIGRNGKVFQGPKTNRRSIMEIREAIREERSVQVPISGREHHRKKLRNVGDLSSDTSPTFGSCRRECEASESEKLKATEAINNVLSILVHYSELSGRLVCGKRYCLRGVDCLSSSLVISLGRIKQSFVLTNPCLPDMPIIYASDAFLTLTGYKRQEVLGQNCRFLSGVDTDSSVLYEMKECILKGQSCTVQILNYRKDKSSFWNLLHISPVRNASGKTAYFVGVQVEASCRNTEIKELRPETRQLSVVGAVRVAVRSSLMVTC
ncbi:unnamed protein product [Arabidopsis thaliana]|uniref:(thale cress) hypothetical protein n=1 Tax=Arabidopsis thaliana TaxID=3702 RepID=A0A7G2EAV8_ARATH|nr:unnamed protein product [Arabidopsis thaliana]